MRHDQIECGYCRRAIDPANPPLECTRHDVLCDRDEINRLIRERDDLRRALRGLALWRAEEVDGCDLCGKRWAEEGERHAPGCLASSDDERELNAAREALERAR